MGFGGLNYKIWIIITIILLIICSFALFFIFIPGKNLFESVKERELFHYSPEETSFIESIDQNITISEPGNFEYYIYSYQTCTPSEFCQLYIHLTLSIVVNGEIYEYTVDETSNYEASNKNEKIEFDKRWKSEFIESGWTMSTISSTSNYLDWDISVRYINNDIEKEEKVLETITKLIVYSAFIGLIGGVLILIWAIPELSKEKKIEKSIIEKREDICSECGGQINKELRYCVKYGRKVEGYNNKINYRVESDSEDIEVLRKKKNNYSICSFICLILTFQLISIGYFLHLVALENQITFLAALSIYQIVIFTTIGLFVLVCIFGVKAGKLVKLCNLKDSVLKRIDIINKTLQGKHRFRIPLKKDIEGYKEKFSEYNYEISKFAKTRKKSILKSNICFFLFIFTIILSAILSFLKPIEFSNEIYELYGEDVQKNFYFFLLLPIAFIGLYPIGTIIILKYDKIRYTTLKLGQNFEDKELEEYVLYLKTIQLRGYGRAISGICISIYTILFIWFLNVMLITIA